ncbi:MAG: hypothetical protein HQL38_12135 [Alphaproteobacteria bacterium]|nr:hypothetical protein [Alphaproteobacteria bacterium]
MTMMVFLNELSEPRDALDIHTGRALMDALVKVLKAIKAKRPDTVLHSSVPLNGMALGAGYSVARWCNEPESRDQWRWLRGLENRAPFRVCLGEIGSEIGTLEYELDGVIAEGLGLSHLFGGLAVSFAHRDTWQVCKVALAKRSLCEDDAGEVLLEQVMVEAFHACVPAHVEGHGDWLKLACMAPVSDGADLWARRAELFPRLVFLPRTEAQCRMLLPGHPWLKEIVKRMRELDDALAEWSPGITAQPKWGSLVTPEHKNRKLLCQFNDLDGIKRTFDLHARFTPGCGRLHFRLDPENTKAVIAHVGRKIM